MSPLAVLQSRYLRHRQEEKQIPQTDNWNLLLANPLSVEFSILHSSFWTLLLDLPNPWDCWRVTGYSEEHQGSCHCQVRIATGD